MSNDSKKPKPGPGLTKHQRFEIAVIGRGEIQNAPYNPRRISDSARSRLRRGIKDHGLVEPLVWNKRTGHMVSGHQRLTILDSLERGQDYQITVSVVDVPLEEEVRLNVQLNNDAMMGEWDLELLKEVTEQFDVPFEELGFAAQDVAVLFPELVQPPTPEEAKAREDLAAAADLKGGGGEDEPEVDTEGEFEGGAGDGGDADDHAEGIQRLKDAKKEARDKLAAQNDANFYFTVTCDNRAECNAVLALLDLPEDTKFVTGAYVRDRLHKLAAK